MIMFQSGRDVYGRALAVLLGALLLSPAVQANPDSLLLHDGEREIELSIESLRERADVEFHFFEPYLTEEVSIRGLVFRDLLVEHFGRVPSQLHFVAWDDYDVTLPDWDDPNWILVTHQDDEPISLRQRGPVRLVERDYGSRDPGNLRNFNDWVWMIRSIEAVW
ncbi:hypothetical protein HOP59_20905 [Halomonas sp. MCCC 1A11058]|uniref:Oxidoreductase molybdopterin-binding domain-containing protein n=2 Tax=Billgrantia aerodenitrificans TaxID=2733483 RepID=A0ABS9AXF5_9GAMM|nr:hypothetical protein [Halomonas aerodenitrificans]